MRNPRGTGPVVLRRLRRRPELDGPRGRPHRGPGGRTRRGRRMATRAGTPSRSPTRPPRKGVRPRTTPRPAWTHCHGNWTPWPRAARTTRSARAPARKPANGEASNVSTTPHASGAATTHPATTGPTPAPDAPYGHRDAPATRTPSTTDTAPTQPVPATSPEPEPQPESEAERARRLLVPVSDPEPRQAPSVAPVLPGRPVAARPQTVRAPGVEPGAMGGVPCPWCATANRPDRHYCARCAMPMAA